MLVIVAACAGAAFGALSARKRKGGRFDMVQYGAVYALLFAIIAVFITVILARAG